MRRAWLALHPTCAACGSKQHVQVHHLWPVHFPGGEKTELDPTNFMTLCERPGWNCHIRIGHGGDFKARNPEARKDAALSLERITDREYPKAARHAEVWEAMRTLVGKVFVPVLDEAGQMGFAWAEVRT